MPSPIVTDRRAEPLVLVTFPPQDMTDEDVQEFIADQRALLHSGKRYYTVTDATRAVALGARHRKMMADWLTEAEDLSKAHSIGQAIVLSNPLVRGALTAVFWVRKPAIPTKLFGRLDEAMEHALAVLAAEGFEISPLMRSLAADAKAQAGAR